MDQTRTYSIWRLKSFTLLVIAVVAIVAMTVCRGHCHCHCYCQLLLLLLFLLRLLLLLLFNMKTTSSTIVASIIVLFKVIKDHFSRFLLIHSSPITSIPVNMKPVNERDTL